MSPSVVRARGPGGSGQTRKSTQRERLIAGIIVSTNRDGYARSNVSKIIAEAGVSRPTFYEYFADKDACFLAALEDVQQRLLGAIQDAVEDAPPQEALKSAFGALLRFATTSPQQARFLTSQAMAAGPRALDARDLGIAQIEGVIEAAHARLDRFALVPDVSPRVVLGGAYRLLAGRLRRGAPGLGRAHEELSSWLAGYERPAGSARWRILEGTDPGFAPPGVALDPLPAPGPLRPGRPGVSRADVAIKHRERILYAAARLAEEKGYNATTIADITRLAGVDGRTFYAAFTDKQEAFMAVHELGVQQVMSATAGAFFGGASWPRRIWEGGRAFTSFLQANPMIAHVGFVEAYAVGPGAVQRVEDSHVTFTLFLQEGYQQKPKRHPPSRLALEAIITSIFEIVYREARSGEARVTGMLGHMAFLALAPFLGAEEANAAIEHELEKRPQIVAET